MTKRRLNNFDYYEKCVSGRKKKIIHNDYFTFFFISRVVFFYLRSITIKKNNKKNGKIKMMRSKLSVIATKWSIGSIDVCAVCAVQFVCTFRQKTKNQTHTIFIAACRAAQFVWSHIKIWTEWWIQWDFVCLSTASKWSMITAHIHHFKAMSVR